MCSLKIQQVFKSNSTQNSQICTYLSKYSSQPGHILSKSEKNSLASLHFYYIFRNNSCLHCYLALHYYQIFRKIPTYTIIPSYIFIIFWFKFPTTLLFGTHYYSEHESMRISNVTQNLAFKTQIFDCIDFPSCFFNSFFCPELNIWPENREAMTPRH